MNESDTPRTDATQLSKDEIKRLSEPSLHYFAPAYLARQLERELAAVTKERDELRARLDDINFLEE